MSIVTCAVGCIICWPILLPVNATGSGHQTQFNILNFSNVAGVNSPSKDFYRYYAHVFCAYLFFTFIVIMITRESIYFINLRQAYLVSPLFADRISSRTVLFNAVPKEYLNESRLRRLLGPDLVRNVWIPRHTQELEAKLQDRDNAAMTLEAAETQLIMNADKARRKVLKSKAEQEHPLPAEDVSGSVAEQWLPRSKRPRHRPAFFKTGSVDSIDWCREQLQTLIPEVQRLQERHRSGEGKPHNTAFVEFHTLRDAQSAYQSLTHHMPLRMAPRYIGIYPGEIIWSNMRIRPWERVVRTIGCILVIAAVIIFWTFPVAFVGAISNVTYLSKKNGFQWLGFLNNLPASLSGTVTGLLPVLLLSLLMVFVPIFLRCKSSKQV